MPGTGCPGLGAKTRNCRQFFVVVKRVVLLYPDIVYVLGVLRSQRSHETMLKFVNYHGHLLASRRFMIEYRTHILFEENVEIAVLPLLIGARRLSSRGTASTPPQGSTTRRTSVCTVRSLDLRTVSPKRLLILALSLRQYCQ